MARIEVKSSQGGVPSEWVDVEHVTDAEAANALARLDKYLIDEEQPSNAVAKALVDLSVDCPQANPSDLWHHIVYRHLLDCGWSDQRWKRVSGFALERAIVALYQSRLLPDGVRMRIVSSVEADKLLEKIGVKDTKSTKVDLFIEGQIRDEWYVCGAAHVKSSIAERIQDDVPASLAFMKNGLLSIALTMDAKSYPPPHGVGINHGELGGRSAGKEKERLKRTYIENFGQFDGLFSFNFRTPPSEANTPSGKRIFTMGFHDKQPDQLVKMIVSHWNSHKKGIKL